jgi:hypothetical protein
MSMQAGKTRPLAATVALLFLLYALCGALSLGANPLRHQTITPFDILVSQGAWHQVDPSVHVRNYHRSDILNALVPQWSEARRQIHAGQFPLWNDKVAGGGSFLPLSSTIFTPAFVIFAAAPNPAYGFWAGVVFNLAVAGLGMHLLLRRRFGWLAAVAGALTFELCGFNAAWLYWPHVLTLVWAPWLFLAVDACAEKPGAGRALGIACASALVLLGGFPFLSLLIYEAAALYALVLFLFAWRKGNRAAWRFLGWYASGVAFGILLCALPLASLVHWLHQFDLGYRNGRGSYLDSGDLKQLFAPWAYRERAVEKTMYVGMLITVAALAALLTGLVRWRRATPFFTFGALLLVISAGLVFEWWPMWLIGWLPGMAYNSWSRAIGLLDVSLVILGAAGMDFLWSYCAARRLTVAKAALLALAVVQVLEVAVFFRKFNGPVDAGYYYPQTPAISYLQTHAGPFDYVITDKSFLMSGTLTAYGQREWLAHYFRSPALQRVLHRMAKHPFHTHRASASRFPASDIKYGSDAMAMYNVRFVAIDSRQHPPRSNNRFHRVFDAAGTAVYENSQSPNGPYFLADVSRTPDSGSGHQVRIDRYRPDSFELRYEGSAAGYVVVPMSTTVDWKVTVNGEPQSPLLKDGVLPAVKVSGPATIDFTYSPGVLRWLYPWLTALVAMIVLMMVTSRRAARRAVVAPGRSD